MCALWAWSWRLDLCSRPWHLLWPRQWLWIIFKTRVSSKNNDLDMNFHYMLSLLWPCRYDLGSVTARFDMNKYGVYSKSSSKELWPGHDFKKMDRKGNFVKLKANNIEFYLPLVKHWSSIHSIVAILVFCYSWPLAFYFGLSSEVGICAKHDDDALHGVFIFTKSEVWTKHMMVP